MKNRLFIGILIITLIFLFNSCETEEIVPIDIFETEELDNPVELSTNTAQGTNTLYVNSDRIIQTDEGYHIKGTVFSESSFGIFPATSGDIVIKTNSTDIVAKGDNITFLDTKGESFDFSGYATASFPDVGFLSQFTTEDISGSNIYYNKGSFFSKKEEFSNLPFEDDIYYFHFNIDKSAESTSEGKNQKIKKTTFTFDDFFLDARDPAVFFLGSISTNGKKLVDRLGIGLSAGRTFKFTPDSYGETMEQAVGGTGFTSFKGPLYLSGDIPLKKYPLTVVGHSIINTAYSDAGETDFFERGFDDASFQMGVNGDLTFDRDLIKYLPEALDVSLGHATLQVEYSDEHSYLRLAGEYSQIDYAGKILGEDILKYIPVTTQEGRIYASLGTDLDDYKLFIETSLSLNIPGLGVFPLSGGVLFISPEGVKLSATIDMPYDIGEVNIEGTIEENGDFMLKGSASSAIRFNEDLRYEADINLEISNNGVLLDGELYLPYGIGAAEFTGEISSRGVGLSGNFEAGIDFSSDVTVQSSLSFTANTWEGISMEGSLSLPAGIGDVAVYGEITARGLGLGGIFSSDIDFGRGVEFPAINMSVEASTWDGVKFGGGLNLPYGLGYITAYGGLSSDLHLYLGGELGSNLNIAGVSVFSCDLSLSASTLTGVYISGNVSFPGGIGNVGMNGIITGTGFRLAGHITHGIDFRIISLNTTFSIAMSQSEVDISARGEGCITIYYPIPPFEEEICDNVSVSVNPDWGNGSFGLCMDFPVIGSSCVNF